MSHRPGRLLSTYLDLARQRVADAFVRYSLTNRFRCSARFSGISTALIPLPSPSLTQIEGPHIFGPPLDCPGAIRERGEEFAKRQGQFKRRWAKGQFADAEKRSIERVITYCDCEKHCLGIVESRDFHKCTIYTWFMTDSIMCSAIAKRGHRVCEEVGSSWINSNRRNIWD